MVKIMFPPKFPGVQRFFRFGVYYCEAGVNLSINQPTTGKPLDCSASIPGVIHVFTSPRIAFKGQSGLITSRFEDKKARSSLQLPISRANNHSKTFHGKPFNINHKTQVFHHGSGWIITTSLGPHWESWLTIGKSSPVMALIHLN